MDFPKWIFFKLSCKTFLTLYERYWNVLEYMSRSLVKSDVKTGQVGSKTTFSIARTKGRSWEWAHGLLKREGYFTNRTPPLRPSLPTSLNKSLYSVFRLPVFYGSPLTSSVKLLLKVACPIHNLKLSSQRTRFWFG